MILKEVLNGLEIEEIKGSLEKEISGVAFDSRVVSNDYLFVAIKGFKSDGHDYIEQVINKGATAIIVENDVKVKEDITIIKLKDSRASLSKVSANFYGNPSKYMDMIGITGTNGKTTITYLIKSIFEKSSKRTGIIGTIGNIIDGELIKTENTTPESTIIQKSLRDMVDANVDSCVMEVSSHSLDLKRVEDCNFDVGVFTNLSRDHLDYHETLENYFEAKLKLFFMTKRANIINNDDSYGAEIVNRIANLNTPTITYGIEKESDIFATNIDYHLEGVKFTLNTPKGKIDIHLNIPGEFSVYNALAAASCGYVYDIGLEDIRDGLEMVEGVKGRFEIVPTNRDFTVIIDFAHTPDGLEKVLTTIEQFAEGRVVTLFGAGGNRDKTKRPIMGETVAKHADFSIVTSDNPRNEDPAKIIEDIIEGVEKVSKNYISIVDRREAIRYAIENAKPKDIILLAGKGHETYTIIKDEVLPFDERQIVLDILKDMEN
ncbi:UDP-N-acetylmuramoyl-L-alanyl-D-glutamate--2,6-diaminopimelate ligase [Anaerosalibacter sp. Marseille-P3206]|uniref:UDP-N-acetylmuramoyl-L-alanyl-D-glutamate--2, 6-diaminopimelate ligase n=1 Tax=Anaerosalibacter sp. Marseille-P3206 TaxID=1871005 RepID=UPI000984C3E9|nr:UDP-N-acetylmuramoyl-L-alanyl-D-glutamate--2,6-diaminopimelate ligase [Anaerosalibacter sp. Marseille-P3206]